MPEPTSIMDLPDHLPDLLRRIIERARPDRETSELLRSHGFEPVDPWTREMVFAIRRRYAMAGVR